MRLSLHLLGREIIALDLDTGQAGEPDIVHGPPFGFTGSAICQAEHAGQYSDEEISVRRGGGGPLGAVGGSTAGEGAAHSVRSEPSKIATGCHAT